MAAKTETGKKAPRIHESRFHTNNTVDREKAFTRWIEKGEITARDAEFIQKYLEKRRADKTLSAGRVSKLFYNIKAWRRVIGKPFAENTLSDIHRGIANLIDGGEYAKNTVYDTVTIIKPFYEWLITQGHLTFPISDFPELEKEFRESEEDGNPYSPREKRGKIKELSLASIHGLERPDADMMTKTRADLLTESEIKKMIEACESTRDRAMLMMLYDGGFRIGELGKLTWRQIDFDQYGVVVNVDEKTGKPRYVRLLSASPYIAKWKDDYPFEPSGDNLVFVSLQKKPISYNSTYRQIRRIAERAGIKTKVHPHIFRHSRVTSLMEKKIPESIIKKMMWGSLTTDMLSRYGHLVSTTTDDALLEAAGIKRADKQEDNALDPRQCPMCHLINGPTSRFCSQCGASLTDEGKVTKDTVSARLDALAIGELTDEELGAAIREKIQMKKMKG